MRAIVLERPGRLVEREVADPVAGQGEVLIEVAACGVCMLLVGFMAAPAAAYFTGTSASASSSTTVGALPVTTVTATAAAGTVTLTWPPVSAPAGATVS